MVRLLAPRVLPRRRCPAGRPSSAPAPARRPREAPGGDAGSLGRRPGATKSGARGRGSDGRLGPRNGIRESCAKFSVCEGPGVGNRGPGPTRGGRRGRPSRERRASPQFANFEPCGLRRAPSLGGLSEPSRIANFAHDPGLSLRGGRGSSAWVGVVQLSAPRVRPRQRRGAKVRLSASCVSPGPLPARGRIARAPCARTRQAGRRREQSRHLGFSVFAARVPRRGSCGVRGNRDAGIHETQKVAHSHLAAAFVVRETGKVAPLPLAAAAGIHEARKTAQPRLAAVLRLPPRSCLSLQRVRRERRRRGLGRHSRPGSPPAAEQRPGSPPG